MRENDYLGIVTTQVGGVVSCVENVQLKYS